MLQIPKRSLLVAVLAAWGVLFPSVAAAQGPYPNESVKLVVAFSPGGPTDVVARILGQRLTEKWGQSVVIENRGGAGGNIAARQVAKAEPNGYTVLVTTSAFAVNPSLTANAGYSPESNFRTVIVVGTTPNIIVGAANLKLSTLKELIEAAKT
jgi:tripartite-type tricarboxylate transporter receptor subunit TctC